MSNYTEKEIRVAQVMQAAAVEDFRKVVLPLIEALYASRGRVGARIAPEFQRSMLPWDRLTVEDQSTYCVMARAAIAELWDTSEDEDEFEERAAIMEFDGKLSRGQG